MSDALASLTVIFTEFYYWVTIVFMFLIHVGFCMYEVGASRQKNHMHPLMKHTMVMCGLPALVSAAEYISSQAFRRAGSSSSSVMLYSPSEIPSRYTSMFSGKVLFLSLHSRRRDVSIAPKSASIS